MDRVSQKVAIITDGARGMGAAHARLLVSEGARVVIGDLLDDEGHTLAAELGVADPIEVSRLVLFLAAPRPPFACAQK